MTSLKYNQHEVTSEKQSYKVKLTHKNFTTIIDKTLIDFHFLRDNFAINLAKDKDRNPVVLAIDIKQNNEIIITKNSFTTPVYVKLTEDDTWKSLLVSDAFELQNQVTIKIDKYEIKMEKILFKRSPKKVIINSSTPRQPQQLIRVNTISEVPKPAHSNRMDPKDHETNSSPFPIGIKNQETALNNTKKDLWDYFGGIIDTDRKPKEEKKEQKPSICSDKENNKFEINERNHNHNNLHNYDMDNKKKFSELLPMESQFYVPKRKNNKVIADNPEDIFNEEDKTWDKKKIKKEVEYQQKLELVDSLDQIQIESPIPDSEPINIYSKKSDFLKPDPNEEEKSSDLLHEVSISGSQGERISGQTSSTDDLANRSKLKRLKKIMDDKREEAAKNSVTKAQSQHLKQENQEPCPICLSEITESLATLETCVHKFCFSCIKDWSAVTNECPLCKRRFEEINKCTLDGKKVETIKVEFKRQVYEDNIEDYIDENVAEFCYECANAEDPDYLLICDDCGYHCCHTYCCDPPLEFVPADDWFCKFCIARRRRGGRRGRRAVNNTNSTRATTRNNTRNNTSSVQTRTNSRTNTRSNVNESQPSLLERLFAQAEDFGSPSQYGRLLGDDDDVEEDHVDELLENVYDALNSGRSSRSRREWDSSEDIEPERDLASRNSRRNQNQRQEESRIQRSNTSFNSMNRNRQQENVSIDSLNNFRYPSRNNFQRVNT